MTKNDKILELIFSDPNIDFFCVLDSAKIDSGATDSIGGWTGRDDWKTKKQPVSFSYPLDSAQSQCLERFFQEKQERQEQGGAMMVVPLREAPPPDLAVPAPFSFLPLFLPMENAHFALFFPAPTGGDDIIKMIDFVESNFVGCGLVRFGFVVRSNFSPQYL